MRQGTPAVNVGGRASLPVKFDSRAPRARAIEERAYTVSGGSVEAQDPQLRQALAVLAQSPSVEQFLNVAAAYRRLGITDRAYDYLRRGAELEPQNAAVHDALARLWRDWGFPEFGLSSAYRAVHAAPQSATARHTLGTLLYALGRRQEAQNAFREAVRLDGRAWYAWQNLCTLAMADGHTKEAIVFCRRAAETQSTAHAPSAVHQPIQWHPRQNRGSRR